MNVPGARSVIVILLSMVLKSGFRYIFVFLILTGVCFLTPTLVKASTASRLSGRILLSVGQNGEAWYVNPANLKRYFLGRPTDAFSIMRQLGVGIREVDFEKIASVDLPVPGDTALAKQLSGKIILEVERNGEAWYINPLNLRKYYLGRPDDAFALMRQLGLGITVSDLSYIHKAQPTVALNSYSGHERKTVTTFSGTFTVDIVTIDLRNPKLKIKTLAAADGNCASNCPATSVAKFYERGKGFAAINGTYFDTSATKRNYYFFPFYDSLKKIFINANQLIYPTTGPIMAFDTQNKFYYFSDSRDFKSVEYFESTHGVTLQAAFGNKPRLIEDGLNYLIDWEVDENQRTIKALRTAIGYQDNKLYLVVAQAATVPELAEIMINSGGSYAINLDGGYSTALLYDGEHIIGPGRNVPNAIVFSEE